MKFPKFFKDKQGNIIIWQSPNLLLWMWIAGTVMAFILGEGTPQEIFKTVAHAAIIAWAILELASGDCHFRRSLGLAVLVITLLPLFT